MNKQKKNAAAKWLGRGALGVVLASVAVWVAEHQLGKPGPATVDLAGAPADAQEAPPVATGGQTAGQDVVAAAPSVAATPRHRKTGAAAYPARGPGTSRQGVAAPGSAADSPAVEDSAPEASVAQAPAPLPLTVILDSKPTDTAAESPPPAAPVATEPRAAAVPAQPVARTTPLLLPPPVAVMAAVCALPGQLSKAIVHGPDGTPLDRL